MGYQHQLKNVIAESTKKQFFSNFSFGECTLFPCEIKQNLARFPWYIFQSAMVLNDLEFWCPICLYVDQTELSVLLQYHQKRFPDVCLGVKRILALKYLHLCFTQSFFFECVCPRVKNVQRQTVLKSWKAKHFSVIKKTLNCLVVDQL